MEMRELHKEQAEEIQEAIEKIFSPAPWNDVWTKEQLREYVLELLENRNPLSLGLYEGNCLIGISLGRIKHWCTGTEYWIEEFGILPQWQGKGKGGEFLRKIQGHLAERGIHQMVLLTERGVPAYGFYQKNGFREVEGQVLFAWEG